MEKHGNTMIKETRFLANKPVSSLRLVFDKLKHHFFGRINGAIYGYRLLGTSGIRTGYNSLNIRPGTYFYMDLGATINFEGSLSIGHFVRSNIPLPGLSRSGLVLLKNSIFEAEDNVKLATGAHIHLGSNSRLRIGRNTYIGHNSQIVVKELIEIGRDCAISWNASILDTNLHELDSSANSKAIKIGDHVWIGASVTILSGVEIGDGAVVAAGSIVTKNIPPRALAAGNPARVIRTEVNWK